MAINIGKIEDPFYRYKRPMAIVNITKGKTEITNLKEIAKALETNEKYIIYYIKLTKSVSVNPDNKINAVISAIDVDDIINEYCTKYIICEKCSCPEMSLTCNKTYIYNMCKACGFQYKLPENKFTKFIYKNYL